MNRKVVSCIVNINIDYPMLCKLFKWTFIFLVGLNLPFILLSFYLGFNRPVINLDFLIIIIFLYNRNFIYKFIVFILLLISYYIEILLFALQIFPFIQLKDVAYLSQFYFNSPAIYQILGFSSIILFIIETFARINTQKFIKLV